MKKALLLFFLLSIFNIALLTQPSHAWYSEKVIFSNTIEFSKAGKLDYDIYIYDCLCWRNLKKNEVLYCINKVKPGDCETTLFKIVNTGTMDMYFYLDIEDVDIPNVKLKDNIIFCITYKSKTYTVTYKDLQNNILYFYLPYNIHKDNSELLYVTYKVSDNLKPQEGKNKNIQFKLLINVDSNNHN